MRQRDGLITTAIIVLVVAVAAWSKLRHVEGELYEADGRRPISEHPAFRKE